MPIEPGALNTFRPPTRIETPPSPLAGNTEETQGGRTPFMERLTEAVQEVNGLQQDASVQAEKLATGEADNLQNVVVALEKADLALQLTIQVTQKAVEAYKEIARMQV